MRTSIFNLSQFRVIDFCSVILPTVKKLTNKLPDLLSKIESINQQLLPLGNISDNVDRIRELIQQARDAANKVGLCTPGLLINYHVHLKGKHPASYLWSFILNVNTDFFCSSASIYLSFHLRALMHPFFI